MTKPIRIIFVVDIRNWAFDRIANNIKNKISNKFNIDIVYWEDFSSVNKFISYVNSLNADAIHFFFREQLSLIIQNSLKKSKAFEDFCSHAITTHIPDYLFNDELDLLNRRVLFEFIDGYFTINDDLYQIYNSSVIVPAPWGVIHDWIELAPKGRKARNVDDKVKIIWSGNSLWGEYAGYIDYKGLETIIRPAIDELKCKYPNVDFICLDSAKSKVSHTEVLELISDSDILLIASEKEGTPLTLIEAMAHKCAVVSTPVGIASEVLPIRQHEFIYQRSSTMLLDKLDKLLCNKPLIAELGELNYIAWQEHFGDSSPLIDKWHAFFTEALSNCKKRGRATKLNLVPAESGVGRRYIVSLVRAGGRLASRLGLVGKLNNISPKFGAIYHGLVHGNSSRMHIDYSLLDKNYTDRVEKLSPLEPVVIYAPMWKGVAASTAAIFQHYALQYPFTDHEYPEVVDHVYLDKIINLLAGCVSEVIIYSGGSKLHQILARKVKEKNPNKRQYFMWHGSPAQWVDHGQYQFFQSWRLDYDKGVISGIITLKKGLDITLMGMGIKAWYINNPIPHINDNAQGNIVDKNKIKIGVFSAISSWYKNPFPQILSVSSRGNVVLTTNLNEGDVKPLISEGVSVNYIHHMARQDFLKILKKQDVNLYVTNTECSPMIVLESWACLVPCIVGPAGDVYSGINEELADWLVEWRVDDADAISKRIDKVLNNYDRIVFLLKETRSEQRKIFLRAREKLLLEL